jgi:cell division septum initiation protein DivIVA
MAGNRLDDFAIVRNGYDPRQVRETLSLYAEGLRALKEENEMLRLQLSSPGLSSSLPSDAHADEIVSKAHRDADEIRAKASIDAQRFIEEANAHAARLETQINQQIADAQAEVDRVEARLAALNAQERGATS